MGVTEVGKDQFVQFGLESTNNWGSVVAATHQMEVIENTIELQADKIDDPSLSGLQSHRDVIEAGNKAAGSLKFRANYDGQLPLLRALMGGYSMTPVSGDTSAHDHVFIEGDRRSLSLRDYRGVNLGTRHVPGTVITKAELSFVQKQIGTMSLDVIGKDVIDGQGLTSSLNFPSVLPVKFQHLTGSAVDGSGDSAPLNVTGVKLTIMRLHDEFWDLGSLAMQEPVQSDFFTPEWEITYRMKSMSTFQKLRAGTAGALLFMFQDPTTIGTSSKREFEISSAAAKCVSFSDPIQGYGQVIATAKWRAYYDAGTATSLKIRVRNLEAALP